MGKLKPRDAVGKSELAFVILLALVVLLGALVWNANHSAEQSRLASAGGRETAVVGTATATQVATAIEDIGTVAPVEGVPAITPSLVDAPAGSPAIADADVEKYIAEWFAGSAIKSIEYIDGDEADARYGMAPGEFAGRPMAIVTLTGEFPVRVPPEVAPITATEMIVVFDAHTGNELIRTYPK